MSDWARITDVFNAALQREPGARQAFLDEACAGDSILRAEVESLLRSHEDAGEFLEVPAAVSSGLAGDPGGLREGAFLGPYRVVREIGSGGMGVVYLAEDTRLGREVALKVLPPEFVRDEARRERLRLEARAAAALKHPGIAIVYALEDIDGHVCLVTEYLRGETLRSELSRGPLPIDALLRTGIELADALAAAHAAGIVHRDLKPENVLRDEQGRVRILDFGIARYEGAGSAREGRLTRAGTLLGTPAYMSPEQLDGLDVDARSDIFALGVLLFEAAAGRHPFERATPASTAARVLTADPPSLGPLNPALPRDLEAVLRRCLRKDRDERYQSAVAVARDLEHVLAGRRVPLPSDAGHGGRPDTTWLFWWRLHQVATMAVAASMVALVRQVHEWMRGDWTLLVFLAVIAVVAVNGTLRAHLLFTSRFNPAGTVAQLRRTRTALRASDMLFAAALLAAAAAPARQHTLTAALLAAVGLGWAVVSAIVEPATTRSAFGPAFENP